MNSPFTKRLLQNFKKSVNNNKHVTTQAIVILSSIKNETFIKSTSHFANQYSFFQSFSKTKLDLERLALHSVFSLHCKTSSTESSFYNKGNIVASDKNLEETVKMFLGENYTVSDVNMLLKLFNSKLNSHMCNII